MDSKTKQYLERADNELLLAKNIFRMSLDDNLKSYLKIGHDTTFFSNVISNSYYCIFYSAKALLLSKEIVTEPPEEHRKTLEEFEKLVVIGKIDKELLEIYRDVVIKADELLGIFKKEKSKRGIFTYKKLPQANLGPATGKSQKC
ncbi:MAG: hypothetical protein V1870_04680 [Candidatus Aenigmatarchaeota archaeon]